MTAACPRCSASLVPRRADPLQVEACPDRHGVLVRAAEMRRALPVAAHAALEEAMREGRPMQTRCPACAAPMRLLKVARHGDAIEVDACPACGAHWFDEGELDRVRHAPPKADATAAAVPEGAKGFHVSELGPEGLTLILEVVAGALM